MLAVLEMIEEENKRLIAKGERRGERRGEERGMKKAKLEDAKKMLEEGISLDKVLKITGLNKEDIQENQLT